MDDKQLLENIKNIYRRIASAAIRSGRSPEEVRLIAVTKTVESSVIKKALEIGLREFGENRVQEAQKKVTSKELQVTYGNVKWHLVGHLQKNKTKIAVRLFDLIHSVDSIELAEEINKQAEKIGKIQSILVQIKLLDIDSKHGIIKDNFIELLERIKGMSNLSTEGLMMMPPFFDDPEKARPYFRELKEIRDKTEKSGFRLPELSMGMTNDFEIAIIEGATMVRIGTAIFGERIKSKK